MRAPAPTGLTRRGHDETVRVRLADLPVKPLPKAISAYDGKTIRLRAADLPVIGTVAKTVQQRYADLDTVQGPPSKWVIARVMLVLLLASMPILAIPTEVSGLVSQSTSSVAVIVLTAVLGTLVVFAPHRTAPHRTAPHRTAPHRHDRRTRSSPPGRA